VKANVINCSAPHYNLGASKLANWLRFQGWDVAMDSLGDADLVCLSVIFSWDLPRALRVAELYRGKTEIWAGGPALLRRRDWWKTQTGIDAHIGLDQRFDLQRGSYRMIYASRGCPSRCAHCPVPDLEGVKFTYDYDFQPAPILCDNNLSALPAKFQDHIIARYQDTGVKLLDANSGFEPRFFKQETYERWSPILRGMWRFGFDEMEEFGEVHRMMKILRLEPPKKKRVYVLIGTESIEKCYERVQKSIEWGGEPYCQPFIELSSLKQTPSVDHDWDSEQQLHDFARWVNGFCWRKVALADYKPRVNEPPPFAGFRYMRRKPVHVPWPA
jgi:hypothetical protein